MANPTAKIRRLAEVELLRAEIEARRIVKRAIWITIAILIGFLAQRSRFCTMGASTFS